MNDDFDLELDNNPSEKRNISKKSNDFKSNNVLLWNFRY